MTPIPDDVWACGFRLLYYRQGRLYEWPAVFLVRAATYADAEAKLTDIFKNDARRCGAHDGDLWINKTPGEGAVGSIDPRPLFADTPVEVPAP